MPRGWVDFKSHIFKMLYSTGKCSVGSPQRTNQRGLDIFEPCHSRRNWRFGVNLPGSKTVGLMRVVFVCLFVFSDPRGSRKNTNNERRLYIFFFWLDFKWSSNWMNHQQSYLSIIPQITVVWGNSLEQNQNGLESA